MSQPASERCRHVKPDGSSCQAKRLRGSDFCFFHDPDKATARAAASAAGGRAGQVTSLPADAPDVDIKGVHDVAKLLGHTINQVLKGQLDLRIGNAVGYLAGGLLKAIQQGRMEDRLAALEAAVKGQGITPAPAEADADLDFEGFDEAPPQEATP